MPIYEIAIAVKDEPEAHRKKQGDIIAIQSYPWHWGRKEIDEYFIVLLRTDKTPKQIRKVTEPIYRRMDTKELITETVAMQIKANFYDAWNALHIQAESEDKLDESGNINDPVLLAELSILEQNQIYIQLVDKNRFKISFATLKQHLTDLNITRFEDKKCIYQPCKTLVNVKKHYTDLSDGDIYVTSILALADEEFIIDLQSELIWDKLKKTWVV